MRHSAFWLLGLFASTPAAFGQGAVPVPAPAAMRAPANSFLMQDLAQRPGPSPVFAPAEAPPSESLADGAKRVYEVIFTKLVRLSIEPIAPTSGTVLGIGVKPKDWRTPEAFKSLRGRASLSANRYWIAEGSFAFQSIHDWRIEPYARFRSMKRLNHFGLGNDSRLDDRADYAFLDRRVGVDSYKRWQWIALAGRMEAFWPTTSDGQSPDLPSVTERFTRAELPGFGDKTKYLYVGGSVNLDYPYVRSEQPRRGGDYLVSVGSFRDTSGSGHSFTRLEIEGRERFPIIGPDRQLVLHARVSSMRPDSGDTVPFYLMDTLGGADNLRGFRESMIGGDEQTSTLRSFESFRFRDTATVFVQAEFRHRIWSQVFASVFADAGVVAPSLDQLPGQRVHRGVGVGVSLYRANALVIRGEFAVAGGEGHPHYVTTGRGTTF